MRGYCMTLRLCRTTRNCEAPAKSKRRLGGGATAARKTEEIALKGLELHPTAGGVRYQQQSVETTRNTMTNLRRIINLT